MNGYLQRLDSGESAVPIALVGRGPIVLGRDRSCGIRVDDAKISRRHCAFTFRDAAWHVEDLKSTNGTQLNDRPIHAAMLTDGDIVAVGRVRLEFSAKAPGEARPKHAATTQEYVARTGDDFWGSAGDGATGELPQLPFIHTPPGHRAGLLGGRYELGSVIHQGSAGTFVKARDVKSNRVVCVKLLAKRLTTEDAELKRFVRGVQTAAKLQHPNVVQLYRAGRSTARKQWWLAMEFVDGPSLRQVLCDYGVGNMLAPAKVLAIAREIAAALEGAYEKQVLHRNIRPENILLTKSGTAKLSDFALTRGVVLTTLQRITGSNELVGDLAYMAPERTDPDGIIDCRSDLYALGACLYTLLAGRPPFTGRGTVDLIERIRHDVPQPPGRFNLSVPGPLEGVVMKCLAKSPVERFQSPSNLREELVRVSRFQGMWH
jgi:hypothetical protein